MDHGNDPTGTAQARATRVKPARGGKGGERPAFPPQG